MCVAGVVTLPVAARDIVIGLAPPVFGALPKLREKLQNGYPWRPPMRVYELEAAVAGTDHLEISVNEGPFRPLQISRGPGRALEANDGARRLPLRTDRSRMTNLRGFSRHPTIAFRQTRPEPLEVRAIRYEVSYG